MAFCLVQVADCKCNFHCRNFVLEEMISEFEKFYKKTYNEQSSYLASLLQLTEPKRRTVLESVSRRHTSVEYFLPHKNKRVRVCQQMICKTFRVTPRRIQILIEKLKSKEDLSDKRGTHNNRPNKVTDMEKETVKEHIKSFPSQESHYSRTSSKQEYLHPHLSITKMFDLYKEKYQNSILSYTSYREIFKTEFNLRFGAPRSDTCKYCDKLFLKIISASDEDEVSKLEQETTQHHMKAEKAYSSLKEDSDFAALNNNIIVLCVDMQQVIFTPNLSHADVYYQRQYSNYNFAINNLGEKRTTMHFWHESIAKRGSMEIASSILTYIKKNIPVLEKGESRKLIIWSDRCVGQNNNWTMISLFYYLTEMRYFSEVNQKFLVSGHSFLPCDREFALIEKTKKVSNYFVPEDVIEIIKAAKPTNPFLIQKMEQENFFDFSELVSGIRKDKELKITEARWLQISSDEPLVLRVRKSHNVLEPWVSYSLKKQSRGKASETTRGILPDLPRLRLGPLPIKPEKMKDLLSMCEYLSDNNKNFYKSLISE